MSVQRKPVTYSECQSKHSVTGTPKGESRQLELLLDIGGITSKVIPTPTTELVLSTQESVVTNKKQICKDKLTTCSPSTQKQKSSRKSGVDSTTKDQSLKPYWNEFCQEMSDNLWSDIKTDSPDLGSTFSSGCVSKTIANSWFATTQSYLQKEKWWKTYWQSSTFLVVDSMDSASTNLKSKKIRIYPEFELKSTWRKWLSASRYCYNRAIAILRDKWIAKEKLPSAYDLRALVMTDLPDWVDQCPYNLRGNAVIDAHRAFKKTDKKNKHNPRFRSCRQPVHSCKMQSSNWKKSMTYPTHKTDSGIKLSELRINPSEDIPEEMPSDFSLILDRGRWFISFTIPVQEFQSRKVGQPIFLDSGVRTFQTCFDGNKIIEIGNKSISVIVSLCKRLDTITSEIAKATGRVNKRKRFNLRKLANQLRIKIRNLIDECHKKTACFLTDNYSDIFIPTFESKDMVCKATRKINSKSARQMLTWSHYRFKQLLKFKCEIKGVRLHEVTEEYTSKTCTKCGHIHPKLGGNKTFKCPNCGHKIDRDWNGAIGICLKTLSSLGKVG